MRHAAHNHINQRPPLTAVFLRPKFERGGNYMKKANLDIRKAAKLAGVPFWIIANRLGLCDSSFSRMLRFELSATEKAKINSVIQNLSAERQG